MPKRTPAPHSLASRLRHLAKRYPKKPTAKVPEQSDAWLFSGDLEFAAHRIETGKEDPAGVVADLLEVIHCEEPNPSYVEALLGILTPEEAAAVISFASNKRYPSTGVSIREAVFLSLGTRDEK